MATVVVTPGAVADLDNLIGVLGLPRDTRSRVRDRLARIGEFPESPLRVDRLRQVRPRRPARPPGSKDGEYAGVALYGTAESTFAVCDENGAREEAIEGLLEGA